MRIFETAAKLDLQDEKVWVAGDWHGNTNWVRRLLPAMVGIDDGIETILHLGDFWPDKAMLSALDLQARRSGIKRILFIPGNHEPWPQLIQIEEDFAPGLAARISEVVWFLPRPFRFTIAGRRVLALGGASSVDAAWRTQGVDWWAEECISDVHEAAAVAGGPADVMLTHESPVSCVREVQEILDDNPGGFPAAERAVSVGQRERVERIWEAVAPRILIHGHMHVYGSRRFEDGRRVVALACDGMPNNVASLDMRTLELEPWRASTYNVIR